MFRFHFILPDTNIYFLLSLFLPTGSLKASHSPCVSFPSLLHSSLLLQVSVKAWGNWATCSRRDRSVSHARAKNPRASVSTQKRLQRNTLHRLQSNYPSTYQSIITGQHPVVMLFFFFLIILCVGFPPHYMAFPHDTCLACTGCQPSSICSDKTSPGCLEIQCIQCQHGQLFILMERRR